MVLRLAAIALLGPLVTGSLGAQAVEFSGVVRARDDQRLLSCIRVALEDSSGHEVAATRTDDRALFVLPAPGPGIYRLRFEVPVALPVYGPPDTMRASGSVERTYDLALERWAIPQAPGYQRGEPVMLRSSPGPRYPQKLRAADVEGLVLVEFVVQSTGGVDPASVRLLKASHPDFGQAVLTAAPRFRFQPAQDEGVAVCQRVQTLIKFQLVR